ncbi:hypothetical protein QVA66_07895 [Staphylococcus chromogenes]|nr:hypothetical protein [Staphylococcus chromogenes]
MLNPSAVISGWAGLELHGAKKIDSAAPVLYRATGKKHVPGGDFGEISLHGQPTSSPYLFDTDVGVIPVENVATCTVDCLTAIPAAKYSWWVPLIDGLAHGDIRMIQTIDTARTRHGKPSFGPCVSCF